MLEKLQKNPDEDFEFNKDTEARAFLLELGILGKFSKEVPAGPVKQAVFFGENPTHHILAVLFSGNPKESDNGYLVCCLPRSKFGFEEFRQFSESLLGSPENVVFAEPFATPRPDSN